MILETTQLNHTSDKNRKQSLIQKYEFLIEIINFNIFGGVESGDDTCNVPFFQFIILHS